VDRAQKEAVVEELGQIFASSGVVVVAHYAGLTVAEMQALRAKMRDVGGAVRVAKNKLAKIALEGKPCASIGNLLTGMTVLAYSEDPVAAAKVIDAYLTHRRARLAEVAGVYESGVTDPESIVRMVYADVPQEVWPAAELTVRAQVHYLESGETR